MLQSRVTLGRLLVFASVLLMHIVVIIILDRGLQSTNHSHRVEFSEATTYMRLLVDDRSLPRKSVSHRASPHASTADSRRASANGNVVAAAESGVKVPDDPDPVDWDQLASKVAKQAAKEQLALESRRSLDSRPNVDSASAAGLNRNRPHAAGSVENLGGGVYQTWMNSHCYLSSEVDASTGKRYEYKKCVEPTVDGSALFAQFKPEYLKKPVEDICPKNVKNCDHKK